MREHADNFVWFYRGRNGYGHSDVEIASHLEYMGMSNVVPWIRPDDHFKVDELTHKGNRLIEPYNANRYHWVSTEVVGTPSIMDTVATITNVSFLVDNPSDWLVLLLDLT